MKRRPGRSARAKDRRDVAPTAGGKRLYGAARVAW